jgi:predicted peptidase
MWQLRETDRSMRITRIVTSQPMAMPPKPISWLTFIAVKRQLPLLMLWAVGCCLTLFSLKAEAATEPASEFLARIYTNRSGAKLPYRLLRPKNYNPGTQYPVILYLHGAAARGNDNLEPLNWGPKLFLEPPLREKHDFFLVIPQCPRDSGWLDLSWSGTRESQSLELALDLVGQGLPHDFNLDPKRRYVTGVSMGGHAVWVVLAHHPGFFAAAIPVCSGGTAKTVTDAAAKTPVWAFHSDDDHLVPVQQARDMVQAWRAHGGTAKYTEYTGLKHSSWKKAYIDNAMFDWLFSQHLP